MLTAADLSALALLAEREFMEQCATVERLRRVEPREAHEAEDDRDSARGVYQRVSAAAQVQEAYEAQLADAAAQRDAAACRQCEARPVDPVGAGDGLCIPCRVETAA
jgi:hypothetical protein